MGKRNRECYLCGEKYQYCNTCSNDKMKPTWMSEFHSEQCKNIFDICTRFNLNLISKTDAKKELLSYDLSNKENFKDYVKKDLEKILAKESKPASVKKTKVKSSKPTPVNTVEEEIIPATEPIPVIEEVHEVIDKTEE